jgi:hypothetical protein
LTGGRQRRKSSRSSIFPATVSIFRLTIRVFGERAEMPPTDSHKPPKSQISSKSFDRRPTVEKVLPEFDISSDSFVLAAGKRRISLANF